MSTTTAYSRIVDKLREVTIVARSDATSTRAKCPAHDGQSDNSLAVRAIEGQALVYCHGGCQPGDVLAALGMDLRDLYDEPKGARYDYLDRDGLSVLRTVHRTPGKQFRQEGQTRGKSPLYRLPQVVDAVTAGQVVYVVEGEKDVHAVESLGAVATSAPMGASNWSRADATPLHGAHVVAIVDRDAAGEKWAEQVRASLAGKAASLAFVQAATGKDAADHIAAGQGLAELVAIPDPSGWEDPSPLGWSTSLPAFPLDALPEWPWRQWILALATETQTPVDMAGSVTLGVLAGAIGGRVTVAVRDGWSEPTNEYVCVAMPSGARKTPVLDACRRPLDLAEADLRIEAGPAIADARTRRAILEKYAGRMEDAAAKDPTGEAIRAALLAAEDADSVPVPALPRLLAGDATPEALVSLMAVHGGRIVAVSDEAGLFAALTGRTYSDSAQARLDYVLQAYSGSPIRIDRKTRDEVIQRPALTLVTTLQPWALARLIANTENAERGVNARVLWSLPKDTVGHRDIDPPAVPGALRTAYADRVKTLAVWAFKLEDAAAIDYSDGARKVIREHLAWLEPQLRSDARYGTPAIRAWASKLAGHVVRLSAALHFAEHGPAGADRPISDATATAAERLARYYLAHAETAHGLGQVDPRLIKILDVLQDMATPGTPIKIRDVHRRVQRTFTAAASLRDVLLDLAESGWVRVEDGTVTLHPDVDRHRTPGDSGDSGDSSKNPQVSGLSVTNQPVTTPGDSGDSGGDNGTEPGLLSPLSPALVTGPAGGNVALTCDDAELSPLSPLSPGSGVSLEDLPRLLAEQEAAEAASVAPQTPCAICAEPIGEQRTAYGYTTCTEHRHVEGVA